MSDIDQIESFIAQWAITGGSELANTQSFVNGLAALIGVPPPNGSQTDDAQNDYVFERRVFQDNGDGTTSFGRLDAYSGVNVLILWGALIAGSYANQGWLTFRQALAAGGCVRKGEQGVTVCFADRFTPEAEKARSVEQGDDARAIPFLKRFVVFNVAQCDGLPDAYSADAPPLPERELVPVAENLISATGADFRIGGPSAFYSPSQDFVQVPPQPAFGQQIDYYRTALHELGHWTGHKSRLDRGFSGRFGDTAYAREELCAELASAYLCAALGIVPSVLPSIRARGILMPLLVRPNGSAETFEIVAGSRRFLAAHVVANENGIAEPLPCAIMEAGDDAAALEASLIENLARLAPDEVTQWESFTDLVKKGRSVDDISMTFGMPELTVKHILALGNLLPRIRQLYRAEEVDATSVRHLTMATKAQQKAWLALYYDPNASIPKGHQLKSWLFGGASISTSVALFDLETYQGRIVKDLFEKDGYFGDADAFLTAQLAAVEEQKAAYLADGWSDVVVLGIGERFINWQHSETSKRKGGRVYVTISRQGEVEFHEGFLTEKEAKRVARNDGSGAASGLPKIVRPEITSAMTTYIDLHRHAAVRSTLATQPSLALRVMVAHAICGSPLWKVEVQSQKSRNVAITESIKTSVANARFAERRLAVLAVLGFDAELSNVTNGHNPCDGIAGVFARLLDLPDPAVMEVLAIVMAETLASGSRLIEGIGAHIGLDMTDYWVADDTFFSLIRDREVLTALLREVGGDAAATAHATEKGKTIKGVIADCLTGSNGREKRGS